MIPVYGRLLACADFVSDNGIVCDVGTDHAYLVAHLISTGKCKAALAVDINDGPLLAARQTLEKYGIGDKVKVIKSDGLLSVSHDNITDVVIAGMGAELICDIISKAEWLKKGINLVIQSMTHVPYLRKWLYNNGYQITAEKAVRDENFFYAVMKVKYTGEFIEIDEVCQNIGFMDLKDKTARAYAFKQVERLEKAGYGIQKSNGNITNNMLQAAQKIRQRLEI